MTSEATIVVIDDDEAVRQGLDSLFRSAGYEVRLYASAPAFLAAGRPPGPACLVLDIRMPSMTGTELQRRLTSGTTPVPIVFLTGHGDVPTSVKAVKSGAVDFLLKPFKESELLEAVERAIDADLTLSALNEELAETKQRFATLTGREREVMMLVASGLINKRIAQELGVSEVMIKVHRANMLRKMRAESVADLVRMADRLLASPAQPPAG